jgi:hypothetical protein
VIESFVDLTYRGLALGRRIKLTQVRPTTGYLELPMPMPVGTLVAISTDEGVTLEATVTQIHEQVGGSERVPGMIVKPQLGGEAAQRWWKARVALPEVSDEQPPSRSRPVTVRPRSHTVPQAVPEKPPEKPVDAAPLSTEVTATKELSVYVAELPAAPPPEPVAVPQYEAPARKDDKRTTVMEAVDQEMLAKLTQSEGEVERLTRTTGEHEVIDDGLRTTVMDAVDPAALGLDVTASGSFRAAQSQEMDVIDDDDSGDKSSPTNKTPPSGVKKRKKRR